jgi:hypothetical protein
MTEERTKQETVRPAQHLLERDCKQQHLSPCCLRPVQQHQQQGRQADTNMQQANTAADSMLSSEAKQGQLQRAGGRTCAATYASASLPTTRLMVPCTSRLSSPPVLLSTTVSFSSMPMNTGSAGQQHERQQHHVSGRQTAKYNRQLLIDADQHRLCRAGQHDNTRSE